MHVSTHTLPESPPPCSWQGYAVRAHTESTPRTVYMLLIHAACLTLTLAGDTMQKPRATVDQRDIQHFDDYCLIRLAKKAAECLVRSCLADQLIGG